MNVKVNLVYTFLFGQQIVQFGFYIPQGTLFSKLFRIFFIQFLFLLYYVIHP